MNMTLFPQWDARSGNCTQQEKLSGKNINIIYHTHAGTKPKQTMSMAVSVFCCFHGMSMAEFGVNCCIRVPIHKDHDQENNWCQNLALGSMNSERLEKGIEELKLNQTENECDADTQNQLQFITFTELVNNVSLHYQIIRFPKQNNVVSVTNILGGNSDNTGSGIARQLVLKTGLNIIMACNIPKNNPMVEVCSPSLSILCT
ncbi:hypothetical protein TSUD_355540 [Trifolium subterraneum]|uniref:Uncharacterized protein n=1 Tax=Trifolium subterraneum TaxID=3900 RepID=A0A2Z6MMP2_TRISU|nr:hypothetical protein TSUD_355540 [Trifolium subterraneum]